MKAVGGNTLEIIETDRWFNKDHILILENQVGGFQTWTSKVCCRWSGADEIDVVVSPQRVRWKGGDSEDHMTWVN